MYKTQVEDTSHYILKYNAALWWTKLYQQFTYFLKFVLKKCFQYVFVFHCFVYIPYRFVFIDSNFVFVVL